MGEDSGAGDGMHSMIPTETSCTSCHTNGAPDGVGGFDTSPGSWSLGRLQQLQCRPGRGTAQRVGRVGMPVAKHGRQLGSAKRIENPVADHRDRPAVAGPAL